MIRLVALYGTGDCYLVCALARAFEREHRIEPLVVAKAAHGAIPEMFGLRWEIDEGLVAHGEGNLQQCWANHENRIADGATFFAHPHFVRSGARLDQLTVKSRASQADMYRAILHLSPWAPMERPTVEPDPVANIVLMTRSNSWPQMPGSFWHELSRRLGRLAPVLINDDRESSLGDLFRFCAGADLVVGPQCGAMSVVCELGIAARKVIAIRELDAACPYLFGLTESMPYGHCSTFAGNDHADVGHVVVPAVGWEPAVEDIISRWGG